MYVWIYICDYVCMYVCIYVGYVCLCVYVCMYIAAISVTRMGTGSTNRSTPPLLVKFASTADTSTVIRSAKKLRSSTNADIKSSVFISSDYTKLERQEQYKLRVELKRRKAAGEGDLIIRRGVTIQRLHAAP